MSERGGGGADGGGGGGGGGAPLEFARAPERWRLVARCLQLLLGVLCEYRDAPSGGDGAWERDFRGAGADARGAHGGGENGANGNFFEQFFSFNFGGDKVAGGKGGGPADRFGDDYHGFTYTRDSSLA